MKEFKIQGVKIVFNDPAANAGDWVYFKSQAVTYERDSVIIEKFKKDFPHIKLIGDDTSAQYEFLTGLVSRSKAFSSWYAGASVEYSELTQLPLYMQDLVSPKEYKELGNNIRDVNDVIAKAAQDRIKLSEEYRRNLRLIDQKEINDINSITYNKSVTKIATLTTDKLPISIGAMIEGYTPTSKDKSLVDSRREYAKECLIQYKISLLNALKQNPELDIDKVIDEGALK